MVSSALARLLRTPATSAVLAFLVLPNLVFLLPLTSNQWPRALFDIDYLVVGAFAVFLSSRLAIILFLVVGFADLLLVAARVYFMKVSELVFAAQFLSEGIEIPWKQMPLGSVELFLLTLVVAALLIRRVAATRNRGVFVGMLLLAAVATAADMANGSNAFWRELSLFGDVQAVPVNIASSAVANIGVDFLSRADAAPEWRAVPSAIKAALGLPSGGTLASAKLPAGTRNLVLVVVEPWGPAHSAAGMDQWEASALLAPRLMSHYSAETGSVPYWGATTRGELRELCGVDADYANLKPQQIQTCLPNVLRAQGLRTVALHGFSRFMYRRGQWWPRVGFGQTLFRREMQDETARRCGIIFPGMCDDDVIARLGRILSDGKPTFGYVLTLNSHLPLEHAKPQEEARYCMGPFTLTPGECALVVSWKKVFESLADTADSLSDTKTTFVIVGDHAPPLLNGQAGGRSNHAVPYVILRPRQDGR